MSRQRAIAKLSRLTPAQRAKAGITPEQEDQFFKGVQAPPPPKRPGYREAVEWIALNDDTSELTNGNFEGIGAPVTVVMIAHLWDNPVADVVADVLKALDRA